MSRRSARASIAKLLFALALTAAGDRGLALAGAVPSAPDSLATASPDLQGNVRAAIERHIGRPYVWGACGIKSFDCSGFVWRVMQENGILVKRTTARKYYMSLPKVPEQDRWKFGNIVFFDHLKHCGIVDSRETFYHAAVTRGTHLSRFDPLWRGKISGVRAMPGKAHEKAVE